MAKDEKKDFRDYLLADGTVSGKLGTRFYPSQARRTTGTEEPYAVYTIVSTSPEYTHDGTSSTTFRTIVMQLDIFGKTALEAEETGDAILARVESKKFTQGTTDFGAVFVDTEFDNFEDAVRDDGSSGLFRKTIQLNIKIDS